MTAALALLLIPASSAAGQETFPCGVASGDVTDTAAICWTKTSTAGALRLDMATDSGFQSLVLSTTQAATTDGGLAVKLEVIGLAPATRYYYRFTRTDTSETSPTGTFITAPSPADARSFRFAYSGDSSAAAQPFHLLQHAVEDQPDFWFWAGDIMYADIPAGDLTISNDLAGYRARYAQNTADSYLQSLLASSPVWVQWDDHEVANDYDGGDLEPGITSQRQAEAYQAFFECLPIRSQNLAADPWRIYRSFRYGSLAEFFILDCRQYRSADVAREGGGLDPWGFFLPTIEAQTIRRIQDPSRTMLGAEQLAWLKQALHQSTATWKFILSSVTFTSLLIYPQDRWDGYDAERYDLLRFIDDHGITGVVILAADIHGNVYNPDVTHILRCAYRRSFSPGFAVPEFISCPIATDTLRQELGEIAAAAVDQPADQVDDSALFGLAYDAVALRVRVENALPFIEGNKYSYLVADVRPDGLTVTFRGVPPDPSATAAPAETLYTASLPPPGTSQALPCFLFPLAALTIAATVAVAIPAGRRVVRRAT